MADNWPEGGGGGGTTVEALSVTQNGTYTAPSGKAYSPVTVNVSGGSSDLSTATMTVIGDSPIIRMATMIDMPEYGIVGSYPGNAELESPYTIILYKGKAYANIGGEITSISGDASIDSLTGMLEVTGDCTITVSAS